VRACRALLADLSALSDSKDATAAAIIDEARIACKAQAKKAAASAKKHDEPLIQRLNTDGSRKKGYDEDDVEEFLEINDVKIEATLKKIRKALKEGAAKLEACAGMDKLKEALGDIETKMRFSLNNPALPEAPLLATVPESLPAEFRVEAAVKPVRDFFGLDTCSLDRARALQAEWARHREAVRSQLRV